ncbi:UNVERIFIED_CONTAM: hypothetical protein Sangu_2657600 [Sesamum angustifolium]|uniref:Uncharacterized protein n=1 Tax=Sesamum angustifolium TaxID=2727405 RepID=A0AAW2J1S3_9LAMI
MPCRNANAMLKPSKRKEKKDGRTSETKNPNKLGKDPIPSLEPDKETSATIQPMEELLTIEFTPGNPGNFTKIGSKMTENIRSRVTTAFEGTKTSSHGLPRI